MPYRWSRTPVTRETHPRPAGVPRKARQKDMTTSARSTAAGEGMLREPLLTASDVAALLAVPRSSVYEYARRLHDPLPSLQIGRHRRFYRSAIEAWLSRQLP